MVDVSKTMGSEYIDADMVTRSQTKELVIKSIPAYKGTDFGQKLVCTALMDGVEKPWKINAKTQARIAEKHGTDADNWVDKKISLAVTEIKGNNTIIGTPV